MLIIRILPYFNASLFGSQSLTAWLRHLVGIKSNVCITKSGNKSKFIVYIKCVCVHCCN